MDYEHEVVKWCDKHNTIPEVEWAIVQARTCIDSLTQSKRVPTPYELSEWQAYELDVWQARMPLLKAKALLLGITTE